uniref:Uncharacterized protein n=1 Tax=Knipowitschia caucasica TaxID=637954 RepID=A0AAV2MED5_KNICA
MHCRECGSERVKGPEAAAQRSLSPRGERGKGDAKRRHGGTAPVVSASSILAKDYPLEVVEQRTPYRVVTKRLYDMGLRPALWFPAKLSVVFEDGMRKFLPSVKDAMDFSDSRDRRELMDN